MTEKVTIRIGPEDCSQVRLTQDYELVIRTDGNPAYEIVMDESLLDRLIVAASENPWLTEQQEPDPEDPQMTSREAAALAEAMRETRSADVLRHGRWSDGSAVLHEHVARGDVERGDEHRG
jgi:hypothetical protein